MARRRRFGYNSTRWIRQDWRFVKEKRRTPDGVRHFDTSIKCGGKTKDGRVRLCLPQKVVTALLRTEEGRDALAEQARRKLRNGRGVRTPYNAVVLREFNRFQKADPFEDVPEGQAPPPPPIFEERRFVQGRLF